MCEETELPKLSPLGCSIYVSDVGDTEVLHRLADVIAEVIQPLPTRPLDDPSSGALLRDLLDPPETLPP
jgi:hypothetical protein